MRGRNPKATAQKRVGSNHAETEPAPTILACPDYLDEEAKAEWNRIRTELHAAGVASNVYRAPLAIYCAAWSRWVRAERQVKETGGEVVKSPAGFPIQNPWLAVAHQAQAQMQSVARKFV